MAETSIKISLELADAAAQKALSNFISGGDKAEKSAKKLGNTGQTAFDEIAVHIGKATGAYEIFAGNIAANIAIKAFDLLTEGAKALFDTFVVEGVHAAQEAQDAINSLNTALAQSGRYSKETSDDFLEFAKQLQSTTTFQDDVIIKNAAMIQSLTQLDQNGLKKATVASADLASALGKDLTSASELVAKAANGNVTALSKLGITIQKGQTNAETFANALAEIEGRFGGAAASKVNTYSGAILQSANAFNSLIVEIGNLIVKNPAVISSITELTSIMEEITGTLEGQNSAFTELVGVGLSDFLKASAFVITATDNIVRVFQTLYGLVQVMSLPFGLLTVPIRALSVGLGQATEEFIKFGAAANENLNSLGKSGDGALAGLATDFLRMGNAADKGLLLLKDGANGVVEPLNNAKGKVAELTAEQQRAQAALKSYADDLVKKAQSGQQDAAQEIALLKAKADTEVEVEQGLLDQNLISNVQFLQSKAQIEGVYNVQKAQIDAQQQVDDQARLDQALAQHLITTEEYYLAQQQLKQNFTNSQALLDQTASKNELKNKRELILAEETLERSKYQAVADTFGALSSLMSSSNRELFEIGKASAIASATINTYLAITKTMASVPYPFNIPLAIAQGVAGFVQVANIASTSPSFADGGIVPGNSFTGDNVSANVNSGEMILNRSQQKNLFDVANGASTGGIDYDKMTMSFMKALNAAGQTVSVQIDGKEIMNTVRRQLNSGRTFA